MHINNYILSVIDIHKEGRIINHANNITALKKKNVKGKL